MNQPRQVGDEDLVRRAQGGERTAMVALYQRYASEMYGYTLNQVGDRQDAEDLTSEIFLRLVNALDSFRGQSSFRTWLYAIARNQVRDHWRRNGRNATVPLEATVSAPPPADASAAPRPEVTALGRRVMEALPDNYRRVLQLRVVDGRSIRDTADEMGTTPGNVKVMQHRALRRAAEIAEQSDGPWVDDRDG